MESSSPAMQPDDPRLRDWVSGRLAPAAAEEVERIVRGSAELTRVVDELRAAASGVPEDDVEVAAEWRQIERERIAAERAEAREDVASLARDAAAAPAGRRLTNWPLAAMVAALAAGAVLAIVVNRRIDAARKQQAAIEASGRETSLLEPVKAEPEVAPATASQLPPVSAADAPPEGLGVRLRLRDEGARPLLEELLAGSELRIGGDDSRDEAVPERLTARGVPAAVDALLAAVARRSDHFAVEPFAVQADATNAAASGAIPGTVRLVLEILDEPAGSPAGGAGDQRTGEQ